MPVFGSSHQACDDLHYDHFPQGLGAHLPEAIARQNKNGAAWRHRKGRVPIKGLSTFSSNALKVAGG
tara:strand:+ start:884 stop:1084 length:201 start_codon:yes stop_codon:yes gene_type:complete